MFEPMSRNSLLRLTQAAIVRLVNKVRRQTDRAPVNAKVTYDLTAVKDRKGSVQSPKRVVVVDALPLTGLGKPDKKAVRARFWEGAGRAVG